MAYLEHARRCGVCRAHPRAPCVIGWRLFEIGASELLARQRRAQA